MKKMVNRVFRFWEIIYAIITFLFFSALHSKEKNFRIKQAELLRLSFERLGSVFIKLGQMLALRPDILSDVYCNELYNLLDSVPPFPAETAKEIISLELKKPLSKLFSDFDMKPVASASFAQVHKARLINGDIVAVKVQRPDIKQKIESDISILKIIVRIVDLSVRPATRIGKLVSEFEDWTHDELDYGKEAENIEKFNRFDKTGKDSIRGPKIYKEFSSDKVLTMEYIEGASLSQIIQNNRKVCRNGSIKNDPGKSDGRKIVNNIIRNTLEMAHVYGFFHADPHPANIIYTKKKELIFIDFGIVGILSPKERVLILRYLRSMLGGDCESAFNSLVALCGNNVPKNLDSAKKGYAEISKKLTSTFDSETYLDQQKQSGPVLIEALHLLQKNGFQVPVGIVRYFKAFETVEGLIFALYPDLQVQNLAKEFRRVSILNILDSLPKSLEEKNLNAILMKIISSIEDAWLLN